MEIARGRMSRKRHFPAGLFADPAWDILLDLYISGERGRPVSVSSLCIAASVPPTTALRWIARMEDDGLLESVSDARDRRRRHVHLTASAKKAMEGFLHSLE